MQCFYGHFNLNCELYLLVLVLMSLQEEKFGGFLCMDPMDFVIEKFVHRTISCVIGYRLDIRHRKTFMKLLGIRKQQDNQQRSRQAQELIALPPVLVEGLRNKKKVVLDAYGTILFADIVSFTVFQQIYRQSGSYRY